MSASSDQQIGSVNIDFSVDPNFARGSSSLTAPLLEVVSDYRGDYEVVTKVVTDHDVSTEHNSEPLVEHKFTEATSASDSVTRVEFYARECSRARKLAGVCNEFQEAAIYLQEGVENEKLIHHPTDTKSYWAYIVIHHPFYYITEFVVCVLLMLLAFLEEPKFFNDVPIQVAPCLELIFLLYINSDIILKLLWIKPKFALKHRRTALKCALLVVMFCEAVVVLGREAHHFRVTRAFRPFFLVDTILLQDVRRILRQIFQSLGPIIDAMVLFFFFLTLFALSGFYLFASGSPTNYEFRSFRESFISLYILATTANFPDVMMESYDREPLAPLFFVIYLFIVLYIINNVLLAMVYSTFQDNQKEKFRKLYLHRRNALRHAFFVLAVKGPEHRKLSLQSYLRMMNYYSPYTSKLIGTCMFKAMMKEGKTANEMTIEEFYSFYDIRRLKWSKVTGRGEKLRWYHMLPDFTYSKMKFLTKAVRSVYFKVFMNLIVLSNALYYCILTAHITVSLTDPENRFRESRPALAVNFGFVGIYILEIIIKVIALGPIYYCRSFWNMFDFTVTFSTLIVQLIEINAYHLTFVIPLRFVRLVRFNKRFRAIFNTLAVLVPQIISTIVLLLLIYYFFAIIGMEVFSNAPLKYCCNDSDTGIGMYYAGNGSNVYYLNNFRNLPRSYVTLFELMVVNNWWIIMEGFTLAVENRASRAFFICFHLSTVVVLTVVIAFVVEAFVFKIHLAQQRFMTKNKDEYTLDGEFLKRCEVDVKKEEVEMLEKNFKRAYWAWELPSAFRQKITADIPMRFQGTRRRTKGDLHKQLYKDHLTEWIQEDEKLLESSHYKYDQMPTKLSTTLFQKLKVILAYIFE